MTTPCALQKMAAEIFSDMVIERPQGQDLPSLTADEGSRGQTPLPQQVSGSWSRTRCHA